MMQTSLHPRPYVVFMPPYPQSMVSLVPAQKESSPGIYDYDADVSKRMPLTEVRGILFANSDDNGLGDAFSKDNYFSLGEGQGIFRNDYNGVSVEQWNQAIYDQDLEIADLNVIKARYELEVSKTQAALFESGYTLFTAPMSLPSSSLELLTNGTNLGLNNTAPSNEVMSFEQLDQMAVIISSRESEIISKIHDNINATSTRNERTDYTRMGRVLADIKDMSRRAGQIVNLAHTAQNVQQTYIKQRYESANSAQMVYDVDADLNAQPVFNSLEQTADTQFRELNRLANFSESVSSKYSYDNAPKVEAKLIEIRNNAMKVFAPLPFIESTSINYLSNSNEN